MRFVAGLCREFSEAERLRRYIIRYDTIRPAHPELPYGQGKEGFKAPAERRVTKP